ncbi:MAG: peptide chain release factor N(5)-glutamine methyltransferase [Lachnospiraceae bacterium]|nr:peptide chain release factor N(5)-glutamine methyltransferase [Lachnospiraceae bacterium]
MTYRELYEKGKSALATAGIDEAELDARLLLEFVCGTDRNTLLVHGDRDVTPQEEADYIMLLHKRESRYPLQQLTGVQNFMGLDFCVNEHVLIPRQDTEILVEEVLQNLHDGMHILDMCTGSGCILISLLHYSNNCTGVGADISAEALEVAKQNAARLLEGEIRSIPDMDGVHEIELIKSDLFENISGQFDIIVSNPPYIQTSVIDTLMPEVRDHEPRLALDGSEDGLLFYRKIVQESVIYLKQGGMLFFEIGYDQGEAVSQLMEQSGFLEVRVIKDYGGLDRVVYGTRGFGMTVS